MHITVEMATACCDNNRYIKLMVIELKVLIRCSYTYNLMNMVVNIELQNSFIAQCLFYVGTYVA